jgi:hypothetical protein
MEWTACLSSVSQVAGYAVATLCTCISTLAAVGMIRRVLIESGTRNDRRGLLVDGAEGILAVLAPTRLAGRRSRDGKPIARGRKNVSRRVGSFGEFVWVHQTKVGFLLFLLQQRLLSLLLLLLLLLL